VPEEISKLPLLIHVLRQPALAASLDEASWGLLMRQARTANVLGRTLAAIEACVPALEWPLRVQQTLIAENLLADHRLCSLRWEAAGLSRLLNGAATRLVMLKGAAYALDEHRFARYRHFGDIDILVPRACLDEVERLLNANGWLGTKLDPYDQLYYRRWMHELPPLQHLHRGTNLDVHHAILPLTARYKPDSALLFDHAREARGLPLVDVLSPSDMFLHASAHLFCEGEHENALRNLLDLHDLLETFLGTGVLTARELIDRAQVLDLTVVLALAARYLERVFADRNAAEISEGLREKSILPKHIDHNDWMFDAVFLGFHPSNALPFLALARLTLYLRAHTLRMPFGQLAVHLTRKALKRKEDD